MKRIVWDHLTELKLLSAEEKEHTPISIELCDDREVIISGGKVGLIELADYIVNVALSDLHGYHIHLDEDIFFDNSSLELIIEKIT